MDEFLPTDPEVLCQTDRQTSSALTDPYLTRPTLIARVKDQYDSASWNDFLRIYRGYIYAIIRNMNLSVEDAEDLTQQLVLKIWNKLPELNTDQIKRFRGWISTTTRNFVLDFIRKRKREATHMQKVKQDETLGYLGSIQLPDLHQIADQEWRVNLTNLALENIESCFSGNAIAAFRLSMGGASNREVAEQLGLKKDSVVKLKTRVRAKLLAEIQQLRDDLE